MGYSVHGRRAYDLETKETYDMKPLFRVLDGPFDWGWVNQQVPILRCEDTTGIVAVDEQVNETVGACIMDNWTQNSVQCHFMITTPLLLRHNFLQCCFSYMFEEHNVKYVYGLVPANNKKAVKLNTHMGFTVKARLEEAFKPGVDYILMELKKENCKFLAPMEGQQDGQERPGTSP